MTVRVVQFMPAFFADIDAQRTANRGPTGEPAQADFVEYELPAIRHALSTRFDELPRLLPDRADYRELISTGRTARAYAVVAQVISDGTIEVLGVQIDPWLTEDSLIDPDHDDA